ncbi:MAG: hypothetical protein N4A40_12980 [Tissierellales bacterium]|jgi:hypothetical protein|nr:hypothetical protein [Tissierellales bacterium]
MIALIRKVDSGKWNKHMDKYVSDKEIAPYPITNDMKTCKDNTLSVWEVDMSNRDEFEKVILAIASIRERIQNLDLAIIRRDDIRDKGYIIDDFPGESRIDKYNDFHRNLKDLRMDQVISLSEDIILSLKNKVANNVDIIKLINDDGKIKEPKVIRIREKQLLEMFIKRIEDHEFSEDVLGEKFRKQINMHIEKLNKRNVN